MKKLTAILLALTLVLGLGACAAAGTGSSDGPTAATGGVPEGFLVGLSRVNITPEESVPLKGYGNTSQRMSNGYLDYLYTTCVAMTDEDGNTVLLFNNDLSCSFSDLTTEIRQTISEATGVPVSNIIVCSTHTHSGPDLYNNAEPSIARYKASLKEWMLEAAELALADRRSAAMSVGSVKTEGLNFVRHYVMDDGSFAGDNHAGTGTSYAAHVSDADPLMQMIRFSREGGEDIVMVNWQSHPHRTGSTNFDVSADIIGVMRTKVEEELGCGFAYFTGAAGNINPSSRIASENITGNYMEQGEALADYAIQLSQNLTPAQTGPIRVAQTTFTGKVDHSLDSLVAAATDVQNVWSATNNASKALTLAYSYGLHSQYHAAGVINKANKGATQDLELSAFSIGNVAFAVSTNELFDSLGVYIRENSPFDMTFVLCLANKDDGYIPDAYAYEYCCYEVDTGIFEAGIGEQVAEEYVSLLNELSTSN